MATWSPRLVMSREAATLADLAGAKYDLETTIGFCKQLEAVDPQSPKGYVLVDALSTAIAIRYSRCFTSGVRPRLDAGVVKALPGDLRAIHDFLRVIRDKYAAHSVNALEENHVTVHVREAPGQPAIGGIGTLQARTLVFSGENAARVRELCQAVAIAVEALMKEQQAVVKQQIGSMPVEEVYKMQEPEAYAPEWDKIHLPRRRV
ncbi:MAG: hypothetical protein KBI44_06065 [Thermoanaerobaculia bacterium]|nr:hypothetical protein [Thermoanaerobaculia bacterium]